jgi:tripartite-type tricarboxylate transporter receptor subunit TctC
MNRRGFSRATASFLALCSIPTFTFANSRIETLRILVGYPPGGTTDAAARLLGDTLVPSYASKSLVDNRPGANSRLALAELAKSANDGSVMTLLPESVLTLVPHIDPKNTTYTLDDVSPVCPCAVLRPALAVGPSVPANVKTLNDFIEWARKNPEQANYGTPGPNSPAGFTMGELSQKTGVPLNHIPYKGSAAGVVNLIGGLIAAMVSPIGDTLAHSKEGKLRILAVASSDRSALAPEIPTFAEEGFPELVADQASGIVMPKGTSQQALETASAQIAELVATPRITQAFAQVGMETMSATPDAYRRQLQESFTQWGERVRASGFQPQA